MFSFLKKSKKTLVVTPADPVPSTPTDTLPSNVTLLEEVSKVVSEMRDELRSQVELIHNSMPKPMTATTEPLLTSSTHLLAAEGMAFEGTVELRGRLRPVSDSTHTTTKTTPAEVSNSTTDPVPTTPTVQLIPNSTQAVLPKPVPIATAEPLLTSSTQSPESTQEKTVIDCRQDIRYGCKVCKEFDCYTRAESDKHLLTHKESTDDSMTFTCKLCEDCDSQSEQEVSKHLFEYHRTYKCVITCEYRSQNIQSLEKHVKKQHKSYVKSFECRFCMCRKNTFAGLVQHYHYCHFIDWTDSHSYVCCFCREIVNESNEILDHLCQHWEQFSGRVDCDYCPTKEMSFASLLQHLKSDHNTEDCETQLKTYSTQMFEDLKSKMMKMDPKWEDDKDSRYKRYCRKCETRIKNKEFIDHNCQGKKSNTTLPMVPMAASLFSPSPTPEGQTYSCKGKTERPPTAQAPTKPVAMNTIDCTLQSQTIQTVKEHDKQLETKKSFAYDLCQGFSSDDFVDLPDWTESRVNNIIKGWQT